MFEFSRNRWNEVKEEKARKGEGSRKQEVVVRPALIDKVAEETNEGTSWEREMGVSQGRGNLVVLLIKVEMVGWKALVDMFSTAI